MAVRTHYPSGVGREIKVLGFRSTTEAKDAVLNFVEHDIAKKALIAIVAPAALDKGEIDVRGYYG